MSEQSRASWERNFLSDLSARWLWLRDMSSLLNLDRLLLLFLSVSFGNASRTESQTFGKTRLHQRVSFGNRRNDAPETRRSQDKIQTFQCRKLKGSCLERRNLRRVSRLPTSCIFQLPHRLALSVEYGAFRCLKPYMRDGKRAIFPFQARKALSTGFSVSGRERKSMAVSCKYLCDFPYSSRGRRRELPLGNSRNSSGPEINMPLLGEPTESLRKTFFKRNFRRIACL